MKNKIYVLLVCSLLLIGCSSGANSKKESPKKEAKEESKEYQYFYSQLNKKDKVLYDKLYKKMLKSESGFEIKNSKEEKIWAISDYILADHPELFWCRNDVTFLDGDANDISEIHPVYNSYKGTVEETQKEIEKIRDEIIASITVEGEFEKVKAVYDYVVQNFEVSDSNINDHNIASALLNKKTTSAGYTKTIQYILNGMTIDTTFISGEVDRYIEPHSHSWNMVKVDGDYFYLDAFLGDEVNELPHTCYNKFMLSDTEMTDIYTPNVDYETTKKPNNSWAIRNGTTLTQWDSQALTKLWSGAVSNGKNYIEFKCSADIFAECVSHIADTQEMFDIMNNAGVSAENFSIISNEEDYSIHVYY